MNTARILPLAGLLFLAVSLQAADPAAEKTIRGLVAEQAAAWTAGDAPRYCRNISPDVSFTNLFGMVIYGETDYVARHTEILRTFYKGTTKRHQVRRLRFITPDVAIVDIDNEIHGVKTLPHGLTVPADGIIRTQLMQVYVRRDGRWLLEAFHNVDLKVPAKP